MRAVLVPAIAIALAACGGGEPPAARPGALSPTSDPGDEPGSTRASREAEAAAAAPGPITAAAPLFVARATDAPQGEDGLGATIAADRPIALELDARRFPPRALDPVLLIGPLRFVHYDHPAPGRLRFVAASRALLPEGVPVAVQYGDDSSTRTVVSEGLRLPPETPAETAP